MQPENAAAQFHWGRVNLEQDFNTAEHALLKSAELDLEFVPEVQHLLAPEYEQRDHNPSRLQALVEQYEETVSQAQAERESVSLEDELRPIHAQTERAEALSRFLSKEFPEIRKLYAVEKVVAHFGNDKAMLLALDVNRFHDNVEVNEQKWLDRASEAIGNAFPEYMPSYRLLLEKNNPWREKLDGIDGALIYQRKLSPLRRVWAGLKTAYLFFLLLMLVGLVGYFILNWFNG